MSGTKRKNVRNVNVRNVRTRRNDDLGDTFVKAVNLGNLANMQSLVNAHGLSRCEGWYGGYALLRDAIQSRQFEMAKFLIQKGAKVDIETDCVSTPLHFATRQRSIELVQLLLDKNVRIDARNGKNETALHLAAKAGYVEIVELLLKSNASIMAQTIDDSTPFVLAVENLHDDIVRMLLEHTCVNFKDANDHQPSVENSNSTPLNRILLSEPNIRARIDEVVVTIAECYGEYHIQIVDDLIDYGFVMSHEYVSNFLLNRAIKSNRTKLIKSILTITSPSDATNNLSHLCSAVEKKQDAIIKMFLNFEFDDGSKHENKDDTFCSEDLKLAKLVQLFLAKGADLKKVSSLLHTAVEEKLIEVCKILIANNADLNALNELGETPLHVCCAWEYREESRLQKCKIIEVLLSNGADVKIKNGNGLTAFHLAACDDWKEAVQIFLEFGVDVNLRAEDGSTPLHLAFSDETIKLLCENKANLEARNDKDWTPLHDTAFIQYADKVKRLLKYGADIEALGPNNETALHFAFGENGKDWCEGVIQTLLDNGCDASAKTKDGYTVLDKAFLKAKRNYTVRNYKSEFCLDENFQPEDSLYGKELDAIKMVKKHLMKLEIAGMCQKNPDPFRKTNDFLSDFRIKCQEEVVRMKNEKLRPQFSLHDVLANNSKPLYAKNKSLMQDLKSFNLDEFPIYRTLITRTLKNCKSRLNLINSGRTSLVMLVKTSDRLNGRDHAVLPVELLEQIVSHLSNNDLKSLISCGELLKHQLRL